MDTAVINRARPRQGSFSKIMFGFLFIWCNFFTGKFGGRGWVGGGGKSGDGQLVAGLAFSLLSPTVQLNLVKYKPYS